MASAAPKTSEIKNILTNAIDTERYLSEFECAFYAREVSKLPDISDRLLMEPFVSAAAGHKSEAISRFQKAIDLLHDQDCVHDFCLYLRKIGRPCAAYKLIRDYAVKYDNPSLVRQALVLSEIFFDLEGFTCFTKKLQKYSNNPDEKETLEIELVKFKSVVDRICEECNISDNSCLTMVVLLCLSKAEEQDVVLYKCRWVFDNSISGSGGASFECVVMPENFEKISSLNMDIAFGIANIDGLLELGISGWIKVETPETPEVYHAC